MPRITTMRTTARSSMSRASVLGVEPVEPRPQPEVRVEGLLGLHADEVPHRVERRRSTRARAGTGAPASPGSRRGCSDRRGATSGRERTDRPRAYRGSHDRGARTLPARHAVADDRSVPVLRAPRRRLPGGQRRARAGRVARPGATSARTSPGSTAGACTTGGRCAGFPPAPAPRVRDRHLRAPRPHRPRRLARRAPRASGAATCSGSPPARGIVHAEMFPLLDRGTPEPARAVPDLAEPARARTSSPTRTSRCSGPTTSPRRHQRRRRAHRRGHRDRRRARRARAARAAAELVGGAPRRRRRDLARRGSTPGARVTLPASGPTPRPCACSTVRRRRG